eukprot:Gb_23959 [translate_table: standard]
MASTNPRPAYYNWTCQYSSPILQRKLCHAYLKFPARKKISSSSSYSRNLLWKNSFLRCRTQFSVNKWRLVVSNSGTKYILASLSDFVEFGNRIVKNLKFSSESEFRTSQDNGVSNYDSVFSSLMNQASSINSFDIFAATLGFVAGLAVYMLRLERPQFVEPRAAFRGEWVLFTSPTPFNRFVVLRCPSISFQDDAFLEDVNKKLTKDNRHFIKLTSASEVSGYSCKGNIPNTVGRKLFDTEKINIVDDESEFSYQRICLNAEDGGVISLDWPASLDLVEEQGLDTTLLVVPGTTEGSRDEYVQDFVCKALQYGYFPIVMNPRGCAGSPLTTPRLFTAADSDDICIAAQFIAKSRPWSTLMGVGWGYGANMLAKYLGEVAESTPLTAAVCIDNPFDLEEATRSLSHHTALDEKLTEGLKDILRSNKVLFQGRKKGFDVAGGLSAISIRDFDTAISRVVHGFDTIEDFYTKASTREIIGQLKIPVLFIQNDDIMAPAFSVPRNAIEGNPFTSLLMCLSKSTGYAFTSGQNATIQWRDSLVIEWLAAVELALLKGRHPLLKDIDITIKPPKDSVSGKHLLKANRMNVNGIPNPFTGSVVRGSSKYRIGTNVNKFLDFNNGEAYDVSNGVHASGENGDHTYPLENESVSPKSIQQKGHEDIYSTDVEPKKEDLVGSSQEPGYLTEATDTIEESESGGEGEVERGQVLQTAETVMRVLDATMPGTLADDQKEQVLNAVGRGETLITALQGAVPEEVRGKLTAAVSGAVQVRGINLKLVGFNKTIPTPGLSTVKSKVEEKFSEVAKGKVEGNVADNTGEGKAPQGSTVSDIDTTRQQEMVNIKLTAESSGEHHSHDHETLKNADIKTQSEEKISISDSESQTVIKSEEAEELETSKLDSNFNGQMSGSSSVSKRVQEDMQQKTLKKEGAQEKLAQVKDSEIAFECDEGTDKNNQKQKNDKMVGREVCADEQNQGKESTAEDDVKSASEQQPKREANIDQKTDEKSMNSQGAQNRQNSGAKTDDLSPQGGQGADEQNKGKESSMEPDGKSASEHVPKREASSDQKNDDKNMNSQGDQSKQSLGTKLDDPSLQGNVQSPTISVTQALDALTGFDDSTQMAVTNVFGVIENMIEQFEKEKQQKAEDKKVDGNETRDPDHLFPKDGSSDCSNTSEKEEQDQIVTLDSSVSAEVVEDPSERSSMRTVNAGECASNPRKLTEVGEEGKLVSGLSQLQQQEVQVSQSSPVVKNHANEMRDGVPVKGLENQNTKTRKQEGKDSTVVSVNPNRTKQGTKIPVQANKNDLETFSYKEYPTMKYSSSIRSKVVSPDNDSTNDLFLEYVPEEGQWKLLDQIGGSSDSLSGRSINDRENVNGSKMPIPSGQNTSTHVIEPSYVILDPELESDDSMEENEQNELVQEIEQEPDKAEELSNLVNSLILNALKPEVIRRLGMSQMEALGFDLEEELAIVAAAVAFTVKEDFKKSRKTMSSATRELNKWSKNGAVAEDSKFGTLHGEHIVNAIRSVLRDTPMLGRLIPVGIIVGASLAALRPVFLVVTGKKDIFNAENDVCQSAAGSQHRTVKAEGGLNRDEVESKFVEPTESKKQQELIQYESHQNTDVGNTEKKRGQDGRVMVGAVTAALGATAALASHEMKKSGLFENKEHVETTFDTSIENTNQRQIDATDDRNAVETGQEKSKPNIVSSLAEKAMSVAAPVVPTKRDGEVDHERLVAVLTDLGQKGGMLRLIGKAALLWGGLRGAMSLTDRLIMFLRIVERPLHQRLLGFVCMALLLWSPVVVPLLPTLLQQWTLHTSGGVAGCVSILGLYGALVILVTIWGKRIRGYEQPLEQYGLDISSMSKVLILVRGMIIGLTLVVSLYSAKVFLGYATFTLMPGFSFSSSTSIVFAIKTYLRISKLIGQAVGMGLAVATVEELLFRSWLHEEMAVDLGFHRAVILSGLTFSLVHWSLPVIPGLWLLSVALSGARMKSNGNLSAPIGLHTGIIAGNFIVHVGGFIRYNSSAPAWLTGAYVGNPLAGALGLSLLAILAVLLYPWELIWRPRSTESVNLQNEASIS